MQRRTLLFAPLAAGATIALDSVGRHARADSVLIAGIVFQQDQFFNAIEIGMKGAAKRDSARMLLANSQSRPEIELSLIDTFVARGVKAIVISPISPKSSEQSLRRASATGIKIIAYNTFNLNWDFISADRSSNFADLGRTTGEFAARLVKEKLNGKAKIGLLGFKSQGAEASDMRTNSFLDAARTGGNEIAVVSQQDGYLAERAVSVAQDIITAHPDVDLLFGANEGGTVGSVQAVRNAQKQGKIFVYGIDGSEQLANFLLDDDNVLQAVTAQQPSLMGSESVDAATAILDGKSVPRVVYVPVLGLNREDPAAVRDFRTKWMRLG
jgi:ABC-type sugar transport system substrate-binding protein